ncbi:hypothetical protein [Mucilaginibacter sp. FT3.2]|uniref:hypothetical protein n=1 Tax=Mucilaginibacter sp. FT3.2 TaxID=2723090 RepID=UPI00161D19CB|nr:hypothetical protein [Mucilaginibacter sp. FT3.2]MBB6230927.1 hypothetical protein [Mucilaginibacter sp. FT3.2]
MKPKIFKPFLFALMVLLTIGTISFAQQKKQTRPAVTPKAAQSDDDGDDDTGMDAKDYQQKMHDLQVKMHDLQAKMNALNSKKLNKAMKLKMKNLSKSFKGYDKTFRFDSLKNFAYKFNDSMLSFAYKMDEDITPMIAFGFKDFDKNFNFSYSTDGDNDNNTQSDDDVVKTKSYSKSYSIDGNDVINIDNKFGKITVNTWTKNEVKVDVQIKVSTSNADKAQKLLDNVNIQDSKDGNGVYFKTVINSENSSNGSWGSIFNSKGSSTQNMEINYIVYMPVKNPLTISNKYGSTNLPDLDGKLIISNSFGGGLVAKNLSNPANQVKVKYANACISSFNGGSLDIAFGSLSLNSCDRLTANLSYSSAKIGRIKTSGNINVKFGGGVTIEEVDKNVKDLSVKSSYSSIKLGLGDNQTADFDVTVRYGSFNYGNHDVSLTSKSPADGERGFNPTKNYKGHFGKGGTDKTITINSSFGSVNFD